MEPTELRFEISLCGIEHTIDYARFLELIKAGRDALANLRDNVECDPIADQEGIDLGLTIKAGDDLLERFEISPSPDDDFIPF